MSGTQTREASLSLVRVSDSALLGNGLMPVLQVVPALRPVDGWSRRDLLRHCFKHQWLILVTTLLVSAVAWAFLAARPPVWEATATLWVRDAQPNLPAFLAATSPAAEPPARHIETDVALLRSRDSARRTVQRLQLRPEQLRVSTLEALRQGLNAQRQGQGATTTAQGTVAGEADEARRVDELLANLTVQAQRASGTESPSDVLELRFVAADRDVVAPVLQALLDEYRQLAGAQRHASLDSLLTVLEVRTREARDDLQASEQRLQTFRAAQGARNGLLAAPRRPAPAGAGVGEVATPAPAASASLAQPSVRRQALQRRLDQLRGLYREEAATAEALSQAIQQVQGRQRSVVRATAAVESDASLLERQRAQAQARWDELRARADQIDLYLGAHPADALDPVVTQAPTAPVAATDQAARVWAVAAPLFGLLAGLLLAALRERLDPRLQTPEAAARFLGQRVLAVLPSLPVERVPGDTWDGPAAAPHASGDDGGREEALPPPVQVAPGRTLEALFESNRVAAVRAGDAAARDVLVHGLAQRVRDLLGATSPAAIEDRDSTPGRILLVTSARPGEGKSCVARAMAKRLAVQDGGKVLLIDANAQAANPGSPGSTSADAEDAAETGFFDLLRDRQARATVVRSRRFRRMHTLTAGTHRDVRDLFQEAALAELFERMRARYAWTVIDAGVLPQTGGLASFADGVVVVVDATRTRREVVRGSLDRAGLPADRLLGIVLNRRPQYVPAWLYRAWL